MPVLWQQSILPNISGTPYISGLRFDKISLDRTIEVAMKLCRTLTLYTHWEHDQAMFLMLKFTCWTLKSILNWKLERLWFFWTEVVLIDNLKMKSAQDQLKLLHNDLDYCNLPWILYLTQVQVGISNKSPFYWHNTCLHPFVHCLFEPIANTVNWKSGNSSWAFL